VNIDPEVLKQAKVYAAQQDTTVKTLVETALLAYITRWPKTGTAASRNARRLSVTERHHRLTT
jgi:hypothetical protein